MFAKGSRYRRLPESATLDAQGERQRGKELRVIRRLAGRFQHTVHDGDRLDLLALKYYGDTTRWWQIADANPEISFPLALLDQQPLVEETLVLTHTGFGERYRALLTDLSAIVRPPGSDGELREAQTSFFETTKPAAAHFLASTVNVIYGTGANESTTRAQIISSINARLRLLRSFAWQQELAGVLRNMEAFTFDDPQAKQQWQTLCAALQAAPGVLELQPVLTDATLQIVYHQQMLSRAALLVVCAAHGFTYTPESHADARLGARLVIPPNQVG